MLPRSVIDRPNLAETMHRIKTRLKRRLRTARDFFLISSRSISSCCSAALADCREHLRAGTSLRLRGRSSLRRNHELRWSCGKRLTICFGPSQAKKALPYIDKFMKSESGRRDLDCSPKSVRAWLDPQAQRRSARHSRLPNRSRKQCWRLRASDATAARANRSICRRTDGTRPEQQFAVRRLREAGPFAVPFLVEALSAAGAFRRAIAGKSLTTWANWTAQPFHRWSPCSTAPTHSGSRCRQRCSA